MRRTVEVKNMRPQEFLDAKKEFNVAYLPVGPIEWHGPHMPFGTDALQAEYVALHVAEELGGVVFPTLFCGTERARTPEYVKRMGFEDENTYVVGMDVPGVMVRSMYFPEELFGSILRAYLEQIIAYGFDKVYIINGHGADGQISTCERLSRELSHDTDTEVIYLMCLDKLDENDVSLGHANISETSNMMCVREDNVDLSQLPPKPEKIYTYKYGIADSLLFQGKGQPDFSVVNDPRDASSELGKRYLDAGIKKVVEYIKNHK